jgi:hypothetical protein
MQAQEGQVRLHRCEPDGSWDERIASHPGASIFHTSSWARVLRDTYGYEQFYFTNDQSRPPAAVAFCEIDSGLTGRRGIALPFTDECALLPSADLTFKTLFEFAQGLGKERNWRSLEVRGLPAFSEIGISEETASSLSFYGHLLDLSPGPEAIFKTLHSSTQRAIRKAEKSPVKVEIASDEKAMAEYFALHCLTRRKHGVPPQPFSFFEQIQRQMIAAGKGFIALARLDDRAIAGAVFFRFGTAASYKYGASDAEFDAVRPNNIVMWKAIQHLCEQAAETLDFGRTSKYNEGLRRYKLNWGSQERTIHYMKWNLRRETFVRESDHSSGWQNHFFRHCPIAVSRLVGRLLYRHIA